VLLENAESILISKESNLEKMCMKVKVKGKTVPLQAWTGPEGS